MRLPPLKKQVKKYMIQTELKKLLGNKLVYISIFIGCISCLSGLISYGNDVYIYRQVGRIELISAYQCWLGCLAMGSSVYRLILPILIIPGIDSYYIERNSGYQNFVVTRARRSKYFFLKWGVGLLSVILIVGAVLSITLCVCFILYPGNAPLEENTYINYLGLKDFFIEQPIQFVVSLIAMNILVSIIYYTFGLGISCYVKNRYGVVFAPMAAYFACMFISQIFNVSAISPIALVAPFELTGLNASAVVIAATVELVIALVFLLNCFRKDVTEIA